MNCEQAYSCIKPFIKGTIEDDELKGFLEHVHECKSCYEELDIMYIVSEGLEGLKSDSEESFDFSGMLANRLYEEELRIKKIHVRRVMGRIICVLVFIFLCVLLLRFAGIF